MSEFQLSKSTEKLLKNLSGVSNSILLNEGGIQRAVAAGKAAVATANFPEAWPRETGIYDVGTFLSIISSFTDPKIDFKDDGMMIREGRSRYKYRYSDPSTILVASEKQLSQLVNENPAVEITLPGPILAQLLKMAQLQNLKQVVIAVGDEIVVRAIDEKNPTSNVFEHVIEQSKRYNPGFRKTLTFKLEHIQMLLQGDYTILLAKWPYLFAQHKTEPISYYIVAQEAK